MSEFRLHLLVQELIDALGASASPEEYVEHLQKEAVSVQQPISQSTLRQVAQKSPNPDAFYAKYEELKGKTVDSLGPFVNLLSLILNDKKLREYLSYKASKSSKLASSEAHGSSKTTQPVSGRTGDDFVKENLQGIVSRVRKAVLTPKNNSPAYSRPKDSEKKFRHPNYHPPSAPDWDKLRPNSSRDFHCDIVDSPYVPRPLDGIPSYSQELMLMEDLLYVLGGIEGEYIVPNVTTTPHEMRTFTISESADPSLRKLVEQILPLASCYSVVARFVMDKSKFEHGQVKQALAGAMKLLLNDYMIFLAQLEVHVRHDNMNLQSFWFYLQPTYRTMEVLAHIATTINKASAHGGKVLSLLHEQTTSTGDSKIRDLCLVLTQATCVPYMETLQKWVYKGVIQDPYDEFLVEDNELIQKEELPVDYSDDYWEKRYTVRRERIPVFLEKVADVILRTGKYLNVIRQCGKNVKAPQAREMKYTLLEREYYEVIEQAYHFASQTLLDLLMKENDLMGRLKSVKHYFLHDQGDFVIQFMDMCEGELAKNINDIVPTRLESLLELALRTSAANTDPYKDDMRTELLPYDLICQIFKIHGIQPVDREEYRSHSEKQNLTGLECFSFGYEVKWPVSLVLTMKKKACYQMIFRHLFYCKHVERLLCRVWLSNKVCKTFPVASAQSYVPAFILRQRMLNCIQNLQYYMMVEVIEPNWHAFLDSMSKVKNVDQVLLCHEDYLGACMKDCMLTNPTLLETVNKLLAICVSFCEFFEKAQKYFVDAELNSMLAPSDAESDLESEAPDSHANMTLDSSGNGDSGQKTESFEKSVAMLDHQFSTVLLGLLNKISELGRDDSDKRMLNVLYRLDFNSFYSPLLQSSRSTTEPHVGNDALTSG